MEIEVPMMDRTKIPSIVNFNTSDFSRPRICRPKKNASNPSAMNRSMRPLKTPATKFFKVIFAIDAAKLHKNLSHQFSFSAF
jgi:hypothetical protein